MSGPGDGDCLKHPDRVLSGKLTVSGQKNGGHVLPYVIWEVPVL